MNVLRPRPFASRMPSAGDSLDELRDCIADAEAYVLSVAHRTSMLGEVGDQGRPAAASGGTLALVRRARPDRADLLHESQNASRSGPGGRLGAARGGRRSPKTREALAHAGPTRRGGWRDDPGERALSPVKTSPCARVPSLVPLATRMGPPESGGETS
jgi:hypothetical protein